MKNKKCVVCANKKGKRLCQVKDNKMICPTCCVDLRNADCENCQYYSTAKRFNESKKTKHGIKPFIAEINEDVENDVDQALLLLDKGKINKAQDIINILKRDHPRNYYIFYGLGVTHIFKKQYVESIKCFEKSIDIFPYFVAAHFNKAVACQKILDITNTIKSFKDVVEIGDPTDETVKEAQNILAMLEKSIYESEGINLDTLLKSKEKFDQGFLYIEEGKWEKAICEFETCLAINKNHVQSYGNMGICYAKLGQKAKALAAFDKAIELDPSYEPAIINRLEIVALKDGEKLDTCDHETINYYKDYPLKKKSYIQSVLQNLRNKQHR